MPTAPILEQSPTPWKVTEAAPYQATPMYRLVDADGDRVGVGDNSDHALLTLIAASVNIVGALDTEMAAESAIAHTLFTPALRMVETMLEQAR